LRQGALQAASYREFATGSEPYDVVVVGGGTFFFVFGQNLIIQAIYKGPGGYVAAIKAAQLGLKVKLSAFDVAHLNLTE